MIWILTLVGAIAGLVTGELPGLVAGGVLGYLLAIVGTLRERLAQLERKITDLESLQESTASRNVSETALQSSGPAAAEVVAQVHEQAQPEVADESMSAAPSAAAIHKHQPQASIIPEAEESPAVNPWVTDSSKSVYLSQPTLIDKFFKLVKKYFTEGNLIVRVGVVVLFFGVSFLVKYSIDNSLVPIELRLAGVVLGSLVMLMVGWHFRIKKPEYALVMQGGAVAIIYLTIFASYKLYYLMTPGFTFPLLIVFSILAMILAVLQNSRALAVIAITGGFVSPILTSTGSNDYISLFSYYLVLNLAIFAVSWFKSWRLLNVVGFAFTFIIGTLWGVTKYQAENFAATEPFLITFFLIYVAISILFAVKQKPELKGYVDGTLVFGVPLVGFGLQAALVHDMEYGLAWSSFVLGMFYLAVVKTLWNNSNRNFRLLCEAMLAMGVIFITLTIPFALDGRWTAATWAIEGAGFIWIGLRQQRKLVVLFGSLIQLAGGLLYLLDYPYFGDAIVFLNTEYLGTLIVSIAALLSAYLFNRHGSEKLKLVYADVFFLVWALCWWYLGGLNQIEKHILSSYELTAAVAFFAISALLALAGVLRYQWKLFNFYPWLLLVPLSFCYLIAADHSHMFAHYGYLAWPLALLVSYVILNASEKAGYELFKSGGLHTLSYLLLMAVGAFEMNWLLLDLELADSWAAASVVAVMIFALQAINRLAVWPFTSAPAAYRLHTGLILIAAILLWSLGANFFQFMAPEPLPYIPLFNPIDIMQAIAVFVGLEWHRRYSADYSLLINKKRLLELLGGFCFIWFNVMLFKTIHVIDGVAYRPDALFNSALVQMAVSISWTLIGLAVMVFASRKLQRQLWIVGATLTGIVVAKLFLLDLSERGTVERIVSFMIVGILLLVVGYFSPVPPEKKENE